MKKIEYNIARKLFTNIYKYKYILMTTMQDQDFEVRYLKRKLNSKELKKKGLVSLQPKTNSGKNIQNKPPENLRLISEEKIKPPRVTREMAMEIQKKRNEMKLTQEQLAIKCGLKKEIIRDYEKGVAIAKQSELAKINRVLKLNLKMPKAEKIPPPE